MIRRNFKLSHRHPVDFRDWYGHNTFKSSFLNFYTSLIPEGEKFIIRTCDKYVNSCSQGLQEQVKLLFHQEGSHAHVHEKALMHLKAQGQTLPRLLWAINVWSYRILEPLFPASWSLATAAAIEHYNAWIATRYLEASEEPEATSFHEMFNWHFCEEIEHRCVVHDVLKEVEGRYFTRLLGLGFCLSTFMFFLAIGTLLLGIKNLSSTGVNGSSSLKKGFSKGKALFVDFLKTTRQYISRDFHPSQLKVDHANRKRRELVA